MEDMIIEERKRAIRERVWKLLEREGATLEGAFGTIPNFEGADRTATLLAGLDSWRRSRVVKANPDRAQLAVRVRALEDKKLLYMAVPKMASRKPFFLLDPRSLKIPAKRAADKSEAAEVAQLVDVRDMRPIDLVVCGSVAVNRAGARIGKGAGYSDLEVALLIEAGLVTDATLIAAPVHRLQVIEEEIPEREHDFRVDVIVTPDEVIECSSRKRPPGIVWENLKPEMIAAIPVLTSRARDRNSGSAKESPEKQKAPRLR